MAKQYLSSSFYATSNLKAYWRAEGNSLDETANDHDGTDTAITYGSAYGILGQGASFNGTTSKIVITNHADFRPTGDFSVGGWVKTSTGSRMVFQSYNQQGTGNQESFGIYIYIQSNGVLNVVCGNGTTVTPISYNTTNSIATGAWVHWTVTRSSNTWTTYLNGVADGAQTAVGTPSYHANNYVRIGVQYIDVGSYEGAYFSGSMDDIFFCNGTALTVTQINELYAGSDGGSKIHMFL